MKLFLFLLATLLLSGCGTKISSLVPGGKSIAIEVQKADDNTENYTVDARGQNLHDIMLATAVPFTTELHGTETAMTNLDGVMSTEGKEWHLYINDEPRFGADLTKISFNESAKISWRYETK